MTQLPAPNFSKHNPYWLPVTVIGVRPEFQPQLSWLDFLYASTWEQQAPDMLGAYCVRTANERSVKLFMYQSIRNQTKELLYDEN